MFDKDLSDRYAERGVPTEWEDITPAQMLPAFHLYWRALRSPSGDPDGPDGEAEQLIHDPVKALRKAELISGDGPPPHISTMVVNHEKTLQRFIVHAMVLVSNNPSTVGITLAKEEE